MVEIDVERNLNGSLVLSYKDKKKIYYGYSKADAIRKFKEEFRLKYKRG